MSRRKIQNTKEEWAAEYATREWLKRRQLILTRDHHTCARCGAKENLQVHHRIYDSTLHVWEYTDEYLVTVCQPCHQKIHDEIKVTTLYSKEELPKFNINTLKVQKPNLKKIKKKKRTKGGTKKWGAYATATYYPNRNAKNK